MCREETEELYGAHMPTVPRQPSLQPSLAGQGSGLHASYTVSQNPTASSVHYLFGLFVDQWDLHLLWHVVSATEHGLGRLDMQHYIVSVETVPAAALLLSSDSTCCIAINLC